MSVGHKAGVRKLLWTAKEFYKLLDKGVLRSRRLELVEGVIVQMAAQKDNHLAAIELTQESLKKILGPNFWVRARVLWT